MKIAICVPHYGDVKALWAGSLAAMLISVCRLGVQTPQGRVIPDPILCMFSSSSIAVNREAAAEAALSHGADYLLWLDTDHTFKPDLLARLFAHMAKVPIVLCNYPRRGSPTGPAALNVRNGETVPVYTTEEKARGKVVEEVDYAGLGVCLMNAGVFQKIEQPWFVADHEHGEDGFFFRKLREATGIKPYVDHELSWDIGHIGERVYTNADAEADRANWSFEDVRRVRL